MTLAEQLADRADTLGVELSGEATESLLALTQLLDRWSSRMNLTGHRGPAAILDGLIVDAIAMNEYLPQAQRIADLGTGAGFPGLPLAILRPATQFVLVDAREKRHHFQKTAIRTLGLSNVAPLRGRIEALAPRPCQGVVAQALAPPEEAVELARPWIEPGGWVALPGTSDPPHPGAAAGAFERSATPCYRVPGRADARSLWIGSRFRVASRADRAR